MDMSLDDIIKTNQKYTRGGRGRVSRGRGRGGAKGSGGAFRRVRPDFKQKAAPYRRPKREETASTFDDDTIWEHDLFEEEEEEEEEEEVFEEEYTGPIRAIETGTKVSIQNLEYSVNEENLKEVFGRVGTVKKVVIQYDRSGRSEGNGEITFARRNDAIAAVNKYNGVQVDGKAVRLQIIGSNVSLPARGNRKTISFRGRTNGNPNSSFLVQSSTQGTLRRVRIGGNRGGRGRGRGRRGTGKISAEQLDADLDNYNNMND